MPRQARFLKDHGYYHIFSRSVNRTWIFKDPEDFHTFRSLVHRAKQAFPLHLFHYAFMNTHFHFVLQAIRKEHVAKNLAYIKWHYTQWMRKKYGWRGPLWRERFKSLPIENELYLAACGLYVEYNPLRAGLCGDPANYPYSSARKYLKGSEDALLDDYHAPALPPILQSLARIPGVGIADAFFAGSTAIGPQHFLSSPAPRCLSPR